jgi:hypothetical protein
MFRIITAFASLCLLLTSVNGRAAVPASSNPPVDSAREGARQRPERMLPPDPPRSLREEATAGQPVEIIVNGARKAVFTSSDLDKLQSASAFTTKNGKKSWDVVAVLKTYGIDKGKSVNFYDNRNKKLTLSWDELHNRKKALFTYNPRGKLVLLAGVAERLPGDARSTAPRDAQTKDQQREQMRKEYQSNLIVFLGVRRVEVIQ